MRRSARALAKLSGVLSRRLGRGGGTTLPGRVLMSLDGSAMARLAGELPEGSVVLSATNGKTTTANMVARTLRLAGVRIVHNRAGANLASGVAAALLADSMFANGKPRSELGVFEVDEAALPGITRELDPKVIVLSNLFRDQLDRYGELEHLAELWADVVRRAGSDRTVILCADDPLVASLGVDQEDRVLAGVLYFGVDDSSQGSGSLQHAADSKNCRRCGTAYEYRHVYLGHLGDYSCPRCGAARPRTKYSVTRILPRGMDGSDLTIETPRGTLDLRLPLPGLYNVFNAVAAVALLSELGIDAETIKEGLEGFEAAFGRVERVDIDGQKLAILLIKNPAGANEVLRTLAMSEPRLNLMLALNDRTADGHDISWIWDADFEMIVDLLSCAVCTGTRAEEMALRLKYAGVPLERIAIEPDLGRALQLALDRSEAGGPLYALPTYTAMLEFRRLLTRRGLTRAFWLEDS